MATTPRSPRLLEQHDPLLRRLVGVLVDHRDTDRVLSEGYVKAYRALGRARGDAVTWLGRASYLTALDEVRRRERRRTGGPGRKPLAEPAPAPSRAGCRPTSGPCWCWTRCSRPEAIATILATTPSTVGRLRSRAEPEAAAAARAPRRSRRPPSSGSELGARLLAERAAPPAPPPRLEPPAATPRPSARRDPPLAMQRRPPPADPPDRAGPIPWRVSRSVPAAGATAAAASTPRVVIGAVVVLAVAAALVAVIRLGVRGRLAGP